MSLLLDALKRAEQEKQAKQGHPAAAERARAAPAAAAGGTPALELQPIGSGTPAAPSPAHAAGRSDADAAQAVFKAKTAPASADPPRKSGALWAVVGAIVVVVAGIGAYVWYSVQSLTPKSVARVRPSAAPVAPLPPVEPSIRARPNEPAGRTLPPAPANPGVAVLTPQPRVETPAAPRRSDSEQRVMDLLRDAAPAKPAPLRLTQAQETPRVPTEVAAGYESLRAGDMPAARRSYAAALAADAANVDAQLGLATVEARSGNRAAAAQHYHRVLELDPRNTTALAGLASIADYSQPDRLEAQLRADTARHPASPALRFTLGNLYASQARWHEAQAEFFEAHRLQPASADILFNLAVSLDHLGQSRVAADYYRRALAAAGTQAAQFDPGAAERRLAELGVESPVPVR